MHNSLRYSEGMDPFIDNRDSSLSTSVSNWLYHQESRECVYNQKTTKIPITWWVKGSFVINMDCSKRDCLVLPFFQWYLVPVLRLWFVVSASKTIRSECTNPIKHARPVVESFRFTVSFRSAHVSTHLVVVSKSETRWEQ